tara:strand:- start:2633 stop:2818 length:186 start_codon:yes stop_codon:yes gene_type:complete
MTEFKIPQIYLDEMKHYEKTKIPRCLTCKKNWLKESGGEHYGTWKADCDCIRNKNLRLMIG